MAKEFKKKFMHPTRRKLVDMVLNNSEYEKNATIGFTPEVKNAVKRKTGETWEDKDGSVWTQLEGGGKIRTSKLTDTMSDVRKWLNEQTKCKNEECQKVKFGPTDKTLIKKTGFCTNCLAEKESKIKQDGLYVDYANYRLSQNKISYAKDILVKLNEALEAVKNEYEFINEDGSVDRWSIDKTEDELKNEILEEIENVKKELKDIIKVRDESYEKLKDKNYELVSEPVEITV